MSKKLPGLKRRAPDLAEPDAPEQSPPASVRAKRKPAARTASQTETAVRKSAPAAKSRAKSQKPKAAAMARARTGSKTASGNAASKNDAPRQSQAAASEGTREIPAEVLGPESAADAAEQRLAEARDIIARRTNWAIAGGLVPIPIVDIFAVAGIQLAMLDELSKLYGVPFRRNLAKSIVMSLVGSILPYAAGAGLAGLFAKTVPVLGWGIGLATSSVLAGATTQATGAVFVQHFETGGTFLNFDAAATQDFFRKEFQQARAQHRAA